MKKKQTIVTGPEEYIVPLMMNGLEGRMLRLPAPKDRKREILFVYGHHSSLERWWGLVQDLNQYGAVTMPDLPGFGGMESFYKINEKPTLDTYADYLAAFIKMRYKRTKVSIAALSFGFVVVTRMLQRYPDLVDRVEVLVSVVGFSNKRDFGFTRRRYFAYRWTAKLFSAQLPALFFQHVCLNPVVLRAVYSRMHNAKAKFVGVSEKEKKDLMEFEVHLWQCNDVRTWLHTTVEMLTLNNCNKQIPMPLWHIAVKEDRYFDSHTVEQHLRVIFTDVHVAVAEMDKHAPSVIADVQSAAPMIPQAIRNMLASH